MCVCGELVCMCVYGCVRCVYVCACVCPYIYVHVYEYVCAHSYIYVCVSARPGRFYSFFCARLSPPGTGRVRRPHSPLRKPNVTETFEGADQAERLPPGVARPLLLPRLRARPPRRPVAEGGARCRVGGSGFLWLSSSGVDPFCNSIRP